MLFYIDSKTFLNLYLENEEDWRILDSYYIIVSMRVRVHPGNRIGTIDNATNLLMPSKESLFQDTRKDYKEQYLHQLKTTANDYLARLVKESIKKNYNILFICSKSEMGKKSIQGNGYGYLHYLATYIMETFRYPVYDYKKFAKKKTPLIEYDPEESLALCEKVLKEEKKKRRHRQETTTQGLREYRSRLEGMSRKKLAKKLEKRNIFVTDESKKEMIELLVDLRSK